MLTLGIDLASQPEKTAVCLIAWNSDHATIDTLKVCLTDDDLVLLGEKADKIGVDVPFGWPARFVRVVSAHSRGAAVEEFSIPDLRFRATDLHTRHTTGKWPLSVSTDRIGVPAFRAIRLLARLDSSSVVDRTGGGKIAEVYPAGALIQWGFSSTGKKDFPQLGKSVLAHLSAWLTVSSDLGTLLVQNRDAFDALIASLVARAAALGLCEPIPTGCIEAARTEGWIVLPSKKSLNQLVGISS
jgi:predicted nuclease with RNAse H fold